MILLDPVLGGKIRAVITTLFAVAVAASTMFGFEDTDAWSIASKVVAFLIIAIQILTHGSDVGNVGTGEGDDE